MLKAIRYQIKYGARLIKISASGGVMSHSGLAGAQQYSDEELAAIVDEAHRASSRVKLERLQQQRQDLAACLDALLADAAAGRAYFKVYRQFKMYNDPRLNPELVKEVKESSGA